MTDKSSPDSLANRVGKAALHFLEVDTESPLWRRRGQTLIVLGTISFLSTAAFMLFIMAPAVIETHADDIATNLYWLYSFVFLLGLVGAIWLAKSGMVPEGALLFVLIGVGYQVALSVTGGLATWMVSTVMGLMIVIVITGGMLGSTAALIASVMITALEACLIALHQPDIPFATLVDASWYNLALGALTWGMLRPLEQIAEDAEQHITAKPSESELATQQRLHAELVDHLETHTTQAFGALKMHMRTLSDEGEISDESREAIEEACVQLHLMHNITDELVEYSRLTQPAMKPLKLADFSPRDVVFGVQRIFMVRQVNVDMRLDSSLPKTVYGSAGATRRSLIRLVEYALNTTQSNHVVISAAIGKKQRWEVVISAPQTASPAPSAAPMDALTMMASLAVKGMGGEVHIDHNAEQVQITVRLPLMLRLPRRVRV